MDFVFISLHNTNLYKRVIFAIIAANYTCLYKNFYVSLSDNAKLNNNIIYGRRENYIFDGWRE